MTTSLTALTDPEGVEFELAEEEVGFTYDEAYAVLVGEREPLTASVDAEEFRWVEGDHPRDGEGQFTEKTGVNVDSFNWLTPREADEMHREMTADDPWDLDQEEALEIYTGDAYEPINNRLRGLEYDEDVLDDIAGITTNIRAAMRPLPYNVKTSRGVHHSAFGVMSIDELPQYIGRRFREPGFLSTSIDETYIDEPKRGYVKLDLDVPEGASAAYLGGTVGKLREWELLLDSDTEFIVESVEILPNRGVVVRGRVVL